LVTIITLSDFFLTHNYSLYFFLGVRYFHFFVYLVMKAFLLKDPNNKKWIEAQEAKDQATIGATRRTNLIRAEVFPALDAVAAKKLLF
jgi:hypothetical protein